MVLIGNLFMSNGYNFVGKPPLNTNLNFLNITKKSISNFQDGFVGFIKIATDTVGFDDFETLSALDIQKEGIFTQAVEAAAGSELAAPLIIEPKHTRTETQERNLFQDTSDGDLFNKNIFEGLGNVDLRSLLNATISIQKNKIDNNVSAL